MVYDVPPPPPNAVLSPDQQQNQFVSVPTTPMVQPQPYYDDIVLYSHSPYSIHRDNYYFWLQQCWRTRIGFRFVVLVSSLGVVASAGYVMNVYKHTKRHSGGLWRDGEGQGGIDMSPVIGLLAVGCVVLILSLVILVGGIFPKIRYVNNISDILIMSTSTISFFASLCAIIYSFQHPSMSVDYDSSSPISFRKYACSLKPRILYLANSQGLTGNPLDGVDGRAVILFSSMCGQFNLAWILAFIVLFFELLVMISVPLGRKWKRGLDEVEKLEEKLAQEDKYRGSTYRATQRDSL